MSTKKHGHAKRKEHSPTYKTWAGMRKRCETPSMAAFKYYGGRGISVCERWRDFENFLADMGERPPGMTLDRIDVDGDYSLTNCRWAAMEDQRNNRRDSVRVSAFGQCKTVREWADAVGLPYTTLYLRIRRGVHPEEALRRPWYSRSHQSQESLSRKPK